MLFLRNMLSSGDNRSYISLVTNTVVFYRVWRSVVVASCRLRGKDNSLWTLLLSVVVFSDYKKAYNIFSRTLTVCMLLYFLSLYVLCDSHIQVCVQVCVEDRLMLVSASVTLHLIFWGRVPPWMWSSPVWVDSDQWAPRIYLSLCPHTGFISMCCTWHITLELRIWTQVLMFVRQALFWLSHILSPISNLPLHIFDVFECCIIESTQSYMYVSPHHMMSPHQAWEHRMSYSSLCQCVYLQTARRAGQAEEK